MKPTKFRVWMIPYPPGEPATVEVKTLRDACLVLDTMVQIRQNLEERDLPVWYDDVSGLEVYVPDDEDTPWQEFYDNEGEDFEKYFGIWSDDEPFDPEIFNIKLEDIVGEY